MKAYYEARAPDYDEWYLGLGRFDGQFGRTAIEPGCKERILNDGTRWQVYKRYFEPDELVAELDGGETLFAGPLVVAVRSSS